MALGERQLGLRGQTTDDRRYGMRAAEQVQVTAAADAIAHDASDAQVAIKPANPATSAARLRAMPLASATRMTGAASHFAISAVEPSSLSGDAPSKRPIMPSINATSASRDARSKSRDRVGAHHPAVEVVAGAPAALRW